MKMGTSSKNTFEVAAGIVLTTHDLRLLVESLECSMVNAAKIVQGYYECGSGIETGLGNGRLAAEMVRRGNLCNEILELITAAEEVTVGDIFADIDAPVALTILVEEKSLKPEIKKSVSPVNRCPTPDTEEEVQEKIKNFSQYNNPLCEGYLNE